MAALPQRRFRKAGYLLLLALLPIAAWLALPWAAERGVRALLDRNDIAGHHISFTDMELDPWAGDMRITGLRMAPTNATAATDTLAQLVAEAELVELHGVGVLKLLFKQQLHVQRVLLRAPRVQHTHSLRPSGARGTHEQEHAALALINVDTLLIEGGSGSSTDRSGARTAITVDRIDLRVLDLHTYADSSGGIAFGARHTHFALQDVHAPAPPFHTLSIGHMDWDQEADSVRVYRMHYLPEVGPDHYHARVDHQTELMQVTMDSLVLHGFDPIAVALHGSLVAHTAAVFGMHLQLHRDKSIPLGIRKHKALPSELLRELARSVVVDSVLIHNGQVDYSERSLRHAPYGTLAFTHIQGRLTGLDNSTRSAAADLHLHGTGRIAGQGHASLDMRMDMRPGNSGITMHAELRNMPFAVLNRMTDELVHVSATDGRIHRVVLRMQGDAQRASGTVRMDYEDLHLRVENAAHHALPIGAVVNAVVRSNNMPEQRRYREGPFTVERHSGKGVFNYLWLGMRAGMLEVMVPPRVLKKLGKVRKKER